MKRIITAKFFLFLLLSICSSSMANKQNQTTNCDTIENEYPLGSLIECKVIKILSNELIIQLPNGLQMTAKIDETDRSIKNLDAILKIGTIVPLYLISIDKENGILVIAIKKEDDRSVVIHLENEVLHIVDGNPLAINGTTIGMMLHLRSEIGKRRHGFKQDGKLVGFYTFKNQKYTMAQLITLETEWLNNPTKENKEKRSQLYDYMQNYIKEEFLKLTAPFLEDARGAKGQMVVLITEWAQKAHRMNSHLLAWSHTKESEEASALKSNIPTLKAFEEFCVDLVNFLESLMRSCPKACNQFKEILEQKQKEKQNQQK